jgi:hypothetical protein
MSETVFRIAPLLEFHGPDGTIQLSNVQARVDQSTPPLAALVLIADVSAEHASLLQSNQWMHLTPERCTPQAGGGWRNDSPVRLEARPATDLITASTLIGDDVWDVLTEIRFAKTLPALHDVSSWFALSLTQTDPFVPSVRMGIATTWGKELRV